MKDGRFIVAEVSRNWPEPAATMKPLLSQQFETVIKVNLDRGYVLHSWKLDRRITSIGSDVPNMNETIIAVFEAIAGA